MKRIVPEMLLLTSLICLEYLVWKLHVFFTSSEYIRNPQYLDGLTKELGLRMLSQVNGAMTNLYLCQAAISVLACSAALFGGVSKPTKYVTFLAVGLGLVLNFMRTLV